MIIKPRVRAFMCVTAHPTGCSKEMDKQIAYIKSKGAIEAGPKNVLIIGASTGYGLSTRITAAFGCKSSTLGVFFERPAENGKTASPGWYNTAALQKAAREEGLYAESINGDAFSNEIKDQVIAKIQADLGKIDLVIYSLASPRRVDPNTGEVFRATLKPTDKVFSSMTLDTDKKRIENITLPCANEDELNGTIKVMGGEDWALWIDRLLAEGVLSEGARSIAYSYIGPKVTWPIYRNGTIGTAKKHLETTGRTLNEKMATIGGTAHVAVCKAVVTQASSAIPVVPLYMSILFKVMKKKGVNEGCIEQIHRLFVEKVYSGKGLVLDDDQRLRVDDFEMREDIQTEINEIWPTLTNDNFHQIADFDGYQKEFMSLFGFGIDGVDYTQDVNEEVSL